LKREDCQFENSVFVGRYPPDPGELYLYLSQTRHTPGPAAFARQVCQ
jgi:hypothetical protein